MSDPTPSIITESAASMATMEAEVQALLDASAAQRLTSTNPGRGAASSPAPSQDDNAETSARTGGKAASSAASRQGSPSPSTPTPSDPKSPASSSKIPGPDALAAKPTSAEPGGKPDAAATAPPASPDFSDIPREYVVGKVNSKNWSRLHEKIDYFEKQAQAAQAEAETLRQRVTSAEPPPELQKQLTSLQAERDAILARLEAVAVERSPRFEAAFKPRLEAAQQTAKAAVGPERSSRIEQLLILPESAYRDEQIEAIIQDIGPQTLRAQKLLQSVAEIDRIAAERQSLASQGSQLYKQWQAEEQQATQRQQAERLTHITSTFDKTVSDWKKAGADLDDSSIALARDVFMGKRTTEEVATAAMWVAVGPRAAATALKLQTRVAELEAELGKLKSAQPGTASDAGTSPSGDPVPDEIPSTASYGDLITMRVQQAGLLKR